MTPRNVRSYQSKGLLPPPHRQGRTASYGPEHVSRLRLVRALHDRGLSLRVVQGLIEQGTAEAELARLGREQLRTVAGKTARVPVTPAWVERLERIAPGLMAALHEAEVLQAEDGGSVASDTVLGLGSALYAKGCDFDVPARVMVTAGHSAAGCAPAIAQEADGRDDEQVQLIVQLAAAVYADVLARRLAGDEPPVTPPRP